MSQQQQFPFEEIESQLEALQREFDRVAMGSVACDLLRLIRREGQAHGPVTFFAFEQMQTLAAVKLRCTARWLQDIRAHLRARGILEERRTERGWIFRIDWGALINTKVEEPTTDLSAVWSGALQRKVPEVAPEPAPEPRPEVAPEPAPEEACPIQQTTYSMQGFEEEGEPEWRGFLDDAIARRRGKLLSDFLRSPMPWRDCNDDLIRLDDATVFERLWTEGVKLRWIHRESHRDHVMFLAFCHRIANDPKYEHPFKVIYGTTKRRKDFTVKDERAIAWAEAELPRLAEFALAGAGR